MIVCPPLSAVGPTGADTFGTFDAALHAAFHPAIDPPLEQRHLPATGARLELP